MPPSKSAKIPKPRRSRQQKIVHQHDEHVQGNLFAALPGSTSASPWPPLYRDLAGFRRVLEGAEGFLGLDYEFPPSYRPTVIGIATSKECAAVFYEPGLSELVWGEAQRRNLKLVGHSVIGAEMKVMQRQGLPLDMPGALGDWIDTMGLHYQANMDFVKAPDKDEQEGALGFMNLRTMMSMYLDVPNHKECRGKGCDEQVCPRHDVRGYCAIDAWGSVSAYPHLDAELRGFGVAAWKREEWMLASWIAQQMQEKGVQADMAYVRELESKAEALKDSLFPFEQHGKIREYKDFNPRGSEQILQHFRGLGIALQDSEKETIQKELIKQAKGAGLAVLDEKGRFDPDALDAATLSPAMNDLYRLYQYKGAGKGLDPWFADKYRDPNNIIHPRFNTVGASTERWSSSKPNFQNIPARGFGALVRASIIPRSPDLHFLKADFSQLELRMVLALAGVNPDSIGKDAFTWLVQQCPSDFSGAAALAASSERQIAKSVSHGGDYLEGIQILEPRELDRATIKKEIECGARRIYLRRYMPQLKRDWLFRGGIVTFTGANLAERLFGDKSRENRAKALRIQEDVYFKNFFAIREWQMQVLDFVESHGYVQSPTGSFLRLFGSREDDAKMAVAKLGQGTSAEHVVGILLKYWTDLQTIPVLMVHDELVFEIPATWTDQRAADFAALMGTETHRLTGFKSPFKALRGRSWLEGSDKTPEALKPQALWPLQPSIIP